MAEESVQHAVDAISRRIREELETQLTELEVRHREAAEAARRTAEAEAQQRWSAMIEEVKAEWATRLESEVSAARADAERRMVAEAMRLRVEAEQLTAEAAARARQELEAAVAEERHRAENQFALERDRLSAEHDQLLRQLEEARTHASRLQHDLEALRTARAHAESALHEERRVRQEDALHQAHSAAVAAEARVAERQSQLAGVERLLAGIRSLDLARSLTEVLTTLFSASALEAPRVALFVLNGTELSPWKLEGFGSPGPAVRVEPTRDGLLAEALRRREPVTTSDTGPAAPAFARLPVGRAAIAVPLLVGGQPVAVVYGDDAADVPVQAPASWPEAMQILCRHASANLSQITAARAADVMRRSSRSMAPADAPGQDERADDSTSARRYARLLVSEIKLYNEPAVRIGRERRDLLNRLKPEIDRAKRLYEQRISSSVDDRGALFQQELILTLAGGDPALLGGPA